MQIADGAGDFEVQFEATAGTAQKKLSSGKVAYIGTGERILGHCCKVLIFLGTINDSDCMSSVNIS